MLASKEDYILIISSCPFPYGNASDNAIYTFMAGFHEHGCRGEVVCLYPNLPMDFNCLPFGEYLGVKYRYLHGKIHRSNNRIVRKVDLILSSFLLKKYLRKKSKLYNLKALFVTHVNESYYRNTRFCRSLGITTILVSCEYPEYLIESSPKKLKQFKKYSSYTDKYIFETKTLNDYTRNSLGVDILSIVVPATMPFDDIVMCPKTDSPPYVAYCGSIHSEEKDGLKSIIRAFSLFHREHPEIELKFIGRISRPEYFNQLKALSIELGLQDSISFVGEVDRKNYVQYVVNAKLLIVAKPKDSYYGGGLSSKVIEYLFSGNAVLMTDSDDYVYYLTHNNNVFFVHDNTPNSLAVALRELFDHPEKMESIGKEGKKYALEHFNYHKLTKNLLDFILR